MIVSKCRSKLDDAYSAKRSSSLVRKQISIAYDTREKKQMLCSKCSVCITSSPSSCCHPPVVEDFSSWFVISSYTLWPRGSGVFVSLLTVKCKCSQLQVGAFQCLVLKSSFTLQYNIKLKAYTSFVFRRNELFESSFTFQRRYILGNCIP